jgi:hypothetical protein
MRNWDFGITDLSYRFVPELSQSVYLTCKARCTHALKAAQALMEQYCDGENAWLLEGYKGQFNITTLEPGPKAVVDVLYSAQHTTVSKARLRVLIRASA